MTAKVFVDSNLLIYAHDADAGRKQHIAMEWLEKLWAAKLGRLSTQVLQEFYVNATRKLRTPIEREAARTVVRRYGNWVESPITPQTVLRASAIGEAAAISFWDALIVASAEESGATEILTEDLNHGQTIAGVRVTNPFQF